MKTVNNYDAKTHRSKLIAAAAKGEPSIAKAGKPTVKVAPKAPYRRRVGHMENESKQRSRTSAEYMRRHHLGLF
jgi:antitoxin (DNA-binding transcriptional repressor) of toxin-antitoxin stability system